MDFIQKLGSGKIRKTHTKTPQQSPIFGKIASPGLLLPQKHKSIGS